MPRLFFAVETPENLKQELIKLQEAITKEFHTMIPIPNFKPEHLANSHSTIRFLGNVEESNVEDLTRGAHEAIAQAKVHPFECRLTTCGVFPNRQHARVMWIGLSPEEPFQNIQHVIDESLISNGIPFEHEHAFHPHLTLFRFREHYRFPKKFDFPDLTSSAFVASISNVALIESKTLAEGARHTIRVKFELE